MAGYDDVPGQMPLPSLEEFAKAPDALVADGDLAQLTAKLKELQDSNAEKYNDLLRQGAKPDPFTIIMIRLNTLLTMLSPEDRLRFDIAFEESVSGLLDAGAKEVAQRRLMASPPQGPNGGGLFIPGR